MLRKFWCVLLGFYLSIPQAYAYEFTKITELFNMLQNKYAENLDFEDIALNGLKTLYQFDNSFRLYHSDSKAFLYHHNNLIASYTLPQEKNNAALWKDLTYKILKTGLDCSPNLIANSQSLETHILEAMVSRLDTFSRIDNIPSAHIVSKFDEENNIVYLKPSLFFSGISDDIQKIISAYANLNGIILDLRGCKGGNFNEALKTADLFLDGTIIAYSSNSKKQQKYYNATPGDILRGKPIAVLTDSFTASAAELIAAALSEQSRAIVIGTKTYGKNSIQDIYQFDDQILFLTSGYFYTPSGKSLQNVGLMPQICTGIDNSCLLPDTRDSLKDVKIATKLIKRNFS